MRIDAGVGTTTTDFALGGVDCGFVDPFATVLTEDKVVAHTARACAKGPIGL